MFTLFMESVETIIDDYYKNDMDTVMYDKENPNQQTMHNRQNPQIPYIRTVALQHQSPQPQLQSQIQPPPQPPPQPEQLQLNTNDTYIVDIPV